MTDHARFLDTIVFLGSLWSAAEDATRDCEYSLRDLDDPRRTFWRWPRATFVAVFVSMTFCRHVRDQNCHATYEKGLLAFLPQDFFPGLLSSSYEIAKRGRNSS